MDRKSKCRAGILLREKYPGLSRRLAEECFAAGWIKDALGRALKKGDRVDELMPIDDLLRSLREANASLEIPLLASREGYVVVDKPAGVPGHPLHLADRDTVTHWAFARFPETPKEFPEILPVLTPHRLDTDTSGLLIVALTAEAFAEWRGRFRAKEVTKRYLAWCHGQPQSDRWVVDAAIGKSGPRRRRVDLLSPYRAITRFSVLKRQKDCFLVQADCETGVTHQVRVHAAHSGFPLVGDALYGSPVPGPHLLRACELAWGKEKFRVDVTRFTESVLSARE